MNTEITLVTKRMRNGGFGSLEKILARLAELKVQADGNERELVVFLRALELNEQLWRHTGAATYPNFLREHARFSVERYARGVRALDEIHEDIVNKIGMPAAKGLMRIEDPVKRELGIASALAFVEKNHVPVPEQSVKAVIGLVVPRRDSEQAKRIHELERENAMLRSEVDRLRTKLEALGVDPGERQSGAQKHEGARNGKKASDAASKVTKNGGRGEASI